MKTIKTRKIENLKDVEGFFTEMYSQCIRIHPESSFHNLVRYDKDKKTSVSSFSKEEADRLDDLLDKCWQVAGENGIELPSLAVKIDQKINGYKKI